MIPKCSNLVSSSCLFAQDSNKIQKAQTYQKRTHTRHKENIQIDLRTRKNYEFNEFTNVDHIFDLIFAAEKVQVMLKYQIDCRQLLTNLETMGLSSRDKTAKQCFQHFTPK